MTQFDDELAQMRARMAASNRRQADSFAERMDAIRATTPDPLPLPGSRDFTLADAGPGWRVVSTTRVFNSDEMLPAPLGGICVEVLQDRLVDELTGEVMARTRYRTLATWWPQPWHTLDAGEVSLDELVLDRLGAWACACWLLRPIVSSKRKAPTASDLRAWTDAHRLVMAVA